LGVLLQGHPLEDRLVKKKLTWSAPAEPLDRVPL